MIGFELSPQGNYEAVRQNTVDTVSKHYAVRKTAESRHRAVVRTARQYSRELKRARDFLKKAEQK